LNDKKKAPAWEAVAIFASIAALWPAVIRFWVENSQTPLQMEDVPLNNVMHWGSDLWQYVLYASLATMVLVAFRRVRRLKSAGKSDESDTESKST